MGGRGLSLVITGFTSCLLLLQQAQLERCLSWPCPGRMRCSQRLSRLSLLTQRSLSLRSGVCEGRGTAEEEWNGDGERGSEEKKIT